MAALTLTWLGRSEPWNTSSSACSAMTDCRTLRWTGNTAASKFSNVYLVRANKQDIARHKLSRRQTRARLVQWGETGGLTGHDDDSNPIRLNVNPGPEGAKNLPIALYNIILAYEKASRTADSYIDEMKHPTKRDEVVDVSDGCAEPRIGKADLVAKTKWAFRDHTKMEQYVAVMRECIQALEKIVPSPREILRELIEKLVAAPEEIQR